MTEFFFKAVPSTCPYCGVGCGVLIETDAEGGFRLRGDPDHPANYGRLCSKGTALLDTIGTSHRLLYPEVNGQRVGWDSALDTVASGLSKVIAEHGPDAVAFYVSGQLLTEDYYVANKLMKGFIGSGNIDTNSRLCMSSAVAAHLRAFGEDLVPCSYQDLEIADLIVLLGSNTAWCHPVLYQRIARAKKKNPQLKVVLIDPRRTQTADIADLHLPLRPGSDAFLLNGLLLFLHDQGHADQNFISQSTEGVTDAVNSARAMLPDLGAVANVTQLSENLLEEFFRLFAVTDKVVSVFSQGVNQSSSGVDKGNALINCHLLTGRIGKPGAGPFSFTGQPNAMGGREVGGLANQLAAHMQIDHAAHRDIVSRFWKTGRLTKKQGLKAVDMFKAVAAGRIKAVWIMATNPVVSMPDTQTVRQALSQCELVIVSDCVAHNDTLAYAHVRLPASTWGERDGTVTNSERCISRQKPFLTPPGEARADWRILADVAARMGFGEHFAYDQSQQIFREHAQLSAFENSGDRCFNLSGLIHLDETAYEDMQPQQWPVSDEGSVERLFTDGKYFTATGKARFVAVLPRLPALSGNDSQTLTLNTGRVRDQWHTMTRTGFSSRLMAHMPEPFAEVHPDDAARFDISDNDLIRIYNERGEIHVRARLSIEQRKGSVFVPMHWNDQFSSLAGVGRLIPPVVDPVSGQPESKHAAVAIEPFHSRWHGFLLSRRKLNIPRGYYWSCIREKNVWRYEMTGNEFPEAWANFARDILCQEEQGVNWAEFFDNARKFYRGARFSGKKLESCIYLGTGAESLPPRTWPVTLFEQAELSARDRIDLLAGKPATPREDVGRIICACHGVGEKTILEAIKNKGLKTVEEIGALLQAGTNCGSCLPELKTLLQQQ